MKHLFKFNESFIENTYSIFLSFGGYYIFSKILSKVIEKAKGLVDKKQFLKDLENNSYRSAYWVIEDNGSTIKAFTNLEISRYEIEFDLIKNTVKTDFKHRNRTITSSVMRLNKGDMVKISTNIRKIKNISEEVSDLLLEINDIGFYTMVSYSIYSKNISIRIGEDGGKDFKYSDVKDNIDGIIKRCGVMGLKLNPSSSVTMFRNTERSHEFGEFLLGDLNTTGDSLVGEIILNFGYQK